MTIITAIIILQLLMQGMSMGTHMIINTVCDANGLQ